MPIFLIALAVVSIASMVWDAHDMVTNPSPVNLFWVGVDLIDPSPVPWGRLTKAGGKIVDKFTGEIVFKSFTSNNLKDNLMTLTGMTDAARKAGKLEAHHVLPQEFRGFLRKCV